MEMVSIGKGFWNIRGSFKIGGLLDIGTQASLVKLKNGEFVFLDACELSGPVKAKINRLTENGALVKAILNLHPFHTVFVESLHHHYPDAALYGTSRHRSLLPDLPWEGMGTEDVSLHELFSGDLAFSIPKGVEFISKNQNIHFSSVLVFHKASKTIHVDDTFMFAKLPEALNSFGFENILSFHPTLPMALEKRPGAADDFEDWANNLIDAWRIVENLCAAHTGPLTKKQNTGTPIDQRLYKALKNVGWVLAAHRLRYGNE